MTCLASTIIGAARFNMDSTDEPQKKVFKARKTMKVSDRQQLDAVYKVKGESLNAEVKLLNGERKNGESDAYLKDADCTEVKPELNGFFDPNVDTRGAKQVSDATASDAVENGRDDKDADLTSVLLPTEEICQREDINNPASTEYGDQPLGHNKDVHFNGGKAKGLDRSERKGSSLCGRKRSCDQDFGEKLSGSVKSCVKDQLESVAEEPVKDGEEVQRGPVLVKEVVGQKELIKNLPEGELAEEPQQKEPIPAEPQLDLVPTEVMAVAAEEEKPLVKTQLEGKTDQLKLQVLVEKLKPDWGLVRGPRLKMCLTREQHKETRQVSPRRDQELTEDQLLEELADEEQCEEELADDRLLDELPGDDWQEEKRDLDLETEVVAVEMREIEEQAKLVEKEAKDLKQKIEENRELIEEKAKEMECNAVMEEKVEKMDEECTLSEESNLVEDARESRSMEIDQDSKVDQTKDLPETAFPKPQVDPQNERDSGDAESMETEDIIPILEKLAPGEDRLKSLSKPAALSEIVTRPEVEDKVEFGEGSPSKQEPSENLPSEPFLVLSEEEEDPCVEVAAAAVQLKQPSPTEKIPAEVVEKEPDTQKGLDTQKDEPHKEETPPEKSEAARKKRPKSGEMDGAQQSKRRRYEVDEYEAELRVKITTRADMDRKLQKVMQRLLEDKLCALQCADFDKALVDLKTRVEKIECKKHEDVLSGIQAKIARLLKRFGAAKENMKKSKETPSVQSVQMGPPSKAVNSSLSPRNITAVPQKQETKRNVGDTPATPVQAPPSAVLSLLPSSQSPATVSTPARSMPDRKPIQQRLNGSLIASPVAPVQVMAPVLSSPTTKLLGTNQVSANGQPISVSLQSLQSLPMILHIPVMQNTMQNGTVMQSTTGTLVTNRQSGKMEFIPSQNQAIFGNLQQQPMSLVSAIAPKANNSPSLTGPTVQRNSPASAATCGPTPSVHSVSTAQSVTHVVGNSLSTVSTPGPYTLTTVSTPGQYTLTAVSTPGQHTPTAVSTPGQHTPTAVSTPRQYTPTTVSTPRQYTPTTVSTPGQHTPTTNSCAPIQVKSPSSLFTSPTSSAPPRAEVQINRVTNAGATTIKKEAETTAQSGKASSCGFIDLTLDDEVGSSSQDTRKLTPVNQSGISQPPPLQTSPSQPPQTAPLQQNTTAARTTLQVLPTAQTTVTVNQRPVTQTTPRLSAPTTPTGHQVVYSPLPGASIRAPVQNAVTQGQTQGLRQVSPQTGGVTTAYTVTNGMTIRSGRPQVTVNHRSPPASEPARPVHPAPLPEAPKPQHLPPEAASTSPPQKPLLKLARVQSQKGIVLSWTVLEEDPSCASADSYHLYSYHEDPTATAPSQWKKIGEVKALPLPMACTLTQFISGSKYYFAVQARDTYGRFGSFCDPQSTDVITTQTS